MRHLAFEPTLVRWETVLLRAREKPLPNDDTGVSVRMPAQPARWTKHERRAGGGAFFRLSLFLREVDTTA